MKYILVLCDGMADFPVPALNGSTPMTIAKKPYMDMMSKTGLIGRVKTVPDSLKPGSDTANLSAIGYDAEKCYTGRSPLEALSLGIDMQDSDIAIRCNTVTLSDDEPFENKVMVDYSAGEITTKESRELMLALQKELGDNMLHFYGGISYRHCLIVANGKLDTILTPPHDISKQVITNYLPQNGYGEKFVELYNKSQKILKNHPVNLKRIAEGKNPANCIWLWGQGTKPLLESFDSLYGKKGAVISAVDLLKGIAIGASMQSIDVEGATGTLDTNFDGKAQAAIEALEGDRDFVFVHLEAPDECGHQGDVDGKIKSIELIDQKIIASIFNHFKANGEPFKMLVMPDHYTPLVTLTHDRTPVPFLLYSSEQALSKGGKFTEAGAEESGVYFDYAPNLTKLFLDCE
ncbi:MAG: cofactor-independent phosphoglycerate mutase [Clostridia bacterium]|nr:cofactor-independent phosphoglycerate mutase [Clostridia bacterium]